MDLGLGVLCEYLAIQLLYNHSDSLGHIDQAWTADPYWTQWEDWTLSLALFMVFMDVSSSSS